MMLKDLLVQLVLSVILAAVGVITPFVVGFVQAKIRAIKANLTDQQVAQFEHVVETVVQAAEQLGAGEFILDKKQWAIDTLQAIADARGWRFSVAEFEVAIEAAIKKGLQDPVVFKPLDLNVFDKLQVAKSA